jgi:hypothetical protein
MQPRPAVNYFTPGVPSLVYFLRDTLTGLVKVGHSLRPRRRRAGLQTGSGGGLELLGAVPGDRDRERALHARFACYRERGEWFRPDGDFLAQLWGLLAAEGVLRGTGVPAVR